jgi:hemoglobin
MRTLLVLRGSVLIVSIGLLAAAASLPQDAPRPTINKLDPSRKQPPEGVRAAPLFERLGGTYGIAAVVDDYLDNLAADSIIMANPQIKAACEKAHGQNGIPGLKFQITAWVIEATGGPYEFHGKDMKSPHAGLKITESEWAASNAVLKSSLDKFNVPASEQAELMAIIQKTHGDIVTAPANSLERPTAR